jgi:hypothetical protein
VKLPLPLHNDMIISSNYNMSRFIVSAADEPTCPFGHGSSGEGEGLAKDIIISPQSQGLRGSPSPAVRVGGNLVGRGIANPMSERTRGFEILEGSFLRRRTAKNRNGYPTPRATFFTNLLVTYYKSIIWLNYLKA